MLSALKHLQISEILNGKTVKRSVLLSIDFGLGEGGDFTHQLSYEAPKFKFTKNCHTKRCTATFAKPLLPAGVLSSVSCKSGL
jgi:hypothetical protein